MDILSEIEGDKIENEMPTDNLEERNQSNSCGLKMPKPEWLQVIIRANFNVSPAYLRASLHKVK